MLDFFYWGSLHRISLQMSFSSPSGLSIPLSLVQTTDISEIYEFRNNEAVSLLFSRSIFPNHQTNKHFINE